MSYLTREHYNETCQALVKGPLVLFALSFVFKKKKQEKQEKNKKKTRKKQEKTKKRKTKTIANQKNSKSTRKITPSVFELEEEEERSKT